MNVEQLIRELRKHPKTAEVAWRDHDQDENEINARIRSVETFDPAASFDPNFCKGVRVVLRG